MRRWMMTAVTAAIASHSGVRLRSVPRKRMLEMLDDAASQKLKH
jgi:hypothetical protein